jgi:GNAT superfamily N-acetyltransferase
MEQASVKCVLKPLDLHNREDFDELLRQRIVCGWNNELSCLEGWRKAADEGTSSMFWIIPQGAAESTATNRPVGHVALESASNPPDLEIANPDKSVMTISTLFILPEHRGGGLARDAVRAIEAYAKLEPYGSPACRTLTLHTLSKRYAEDGDEWPKIFIRMGLEPPAKGPSVEEWYERMGYVRWKEEPRYRDKLPDGREGLLLAAFLRKDIS